MQEIIKFFFTIFTVVCVSISSFFNPVKLDPQSENLDLDFLEYPKEAVFALEDVGVTPEEFMDRANAELSEYVQSGGYDDIGGVIVSPYYTAKIGNLDAPVYASLVFNKSNETGDIHSFTEVYVEPDKEFSFNIELTGTGAELKNAIVLPESLNVEAKCKKGVVSATINKTGIYTFLFNGAQQAYGYTLLVREKIDEDKEIAEYIEKYGNENVIIVERGAHTLDYANFVEKDNFVIYLRQGAYITANHHYDIDCVEDEGKWIEEGALENNAICLTRYPFVNFFKCNNVTLTGRGVLDLTRLDRRERRGVVFNFCNNISVSGIKIINSPEWSFITYCCEGLEIEQVDILGNRGNADGFAICNTHDATINNCFVRTADDEFEVKALGGPMGTDNVTFSNCVAWGGYARCFGICGEVYNDITNVTFKDSAVIYRDGVWNNDRIGSLVITAENCHGKIDGILFENIEIFRDEGRAILVKIYDEEAENYSITNVKFKDIKYTSYMQSKIDGTGSDTNTVEVELENIEANNFKLISPFLAFKVGRHCDVDFKF